MLTAEQAVAQLPGKQQSWQIPRMADVVRQVAEQNKVYIFNVGPHQWIRYNGGLGTFVIRGCAAGQRYSEPCELKGITTETNPVDAGVMTLREYDGLQVANDIIGNAAFRDPSDNLTRKGVFVSRTNPPSEAEIEAAEAALAESDMAIIAEGNRFYENNGGVDQKTGLSNIQAHHIEAAKRQGQNPPWTRKASRQVECPACGESIKPNAAMCNHCDAVLDEAKARKFFPHKFAAQEERRGPGRPPKVEA